MYKKEENTEQIIFIFSGKIDSYISAELEKQLKVDLVNNRRQVIFDLTSVSFITSAFLRMCLFVSINRGTDNFIIKNANTQVFNIYKLTGFDKTFNFKFNS